MSTRICLSGATGHVGRELIKALADHPELELVGCTGFTSAGKSLPEVVGFSCPDQVIHASVKDALEHQPFDVLIDYTTPEAVYQTVMAGIAAGVHCVIGTSGLSDEQYAAIHDQALAGKVGVFAAGNFSITAALLMHFSRIAARFVPHWELFDYASDTKTDAPSGTTRELAYLLSQVREPIHKIAPEEVHGFPESRGAKLNGTQVHSVRVPGYYSSSEAVFGLPGERLSIRHDSISYAPYVEGTLQAAVKVSSLSGLVRGMDKLLGIDG